MANSGKQRKNSPGRLYLRTDTLDSSTPLRFAQNDSEGVVFSSLESGSIVKCIPLSARRGRDTERGSGTRLNPPVASNLQPAVAPRARILPRRVRFPRTRPILRLRRDETMSLSVLRDVLESAPDSLPASAASTTKTAGWRRNERRHTMQRDRPFEIIRRLRLNSLTLEWASRELYQFGLSTP